MIRGIVAAALALVFSVTKGGKTVRCPVAGVSFNGVDVLKLRERAPVIIRRETHKGEYSYRILDQDETTIGFVPRKKLPLFKNREVKQAWLSKVNPYAVPWRQLEITASLTQVAVPPHNDRRSANQNTRQLGYSQFSQAPRKHFVSKEYLGNFLK